MKITFKKNPNTEIFIINDKKTKPFVFNKSNNIKLDGVLRDILFKYHLTRERRRFKVINVQPQKEEHVFEVPNHDIHNIKSILIDSLKR